MPNIIVKIPANTFDANARSALGKAVTAAAKEVEGVGDDPRQEALTWVLIEEVDRSNLFLGGADQSERIIPVIVFFYPPAGVIEVENRAKTLRLMDEAIRAAKPEGDSRTLMTSVMIWDVADGAWGANGQRWHLADFAKAAGYKRLQHLVAA